jgi:hypothetical protein
MSCGNTVEFYQGRQNQLVLTIYEDANQTTLEDLTDRTFSVTIYNSENLTVYATAVGTTVDTNTVEVNEADSVITVTFLPDEFADADWDAAEYIVDEITGGTPAPFLTPEALSLKRLPDPELGA